MTKNRDLKSLIRARMEKTGESYAAARRYVVGKTDGISDWTQHEVVLDVDDEATLISIGLVMDGPGTGWLAGLALDTVGPDVPLTASRHIPRHPTNLDFNE